MTLLAQSTNTHFQHRLETQNPTAVWNIWTDVDNWHQWDQGLKSASLNGPFELNAKGKLVPDKGPKAQFKIIQFKEGQSYTMKTNIPLGSMEITRCLEQKDRKWYFTHEVQFKGLLKGLFGKKFGARYRKLLPEVMAHIEQIAQSK